MLYAKRMTKSDLPKLQRCAQKLCEEHGKGVVRIAMKKITTPNNVTYAILDDETDEMVGWKVMSSSGKLLDSMGTTELEGDGWGISEYPVETDEINDWTDAFDDNNSANEEPLIPVELARKAQLKKQSSTAVSDIDAMSVIEQAAELVSIDDEIETMNRPVVSDPSSFSLETKRKSSMLSFTPSDVLDDDDDEDFDEVADAIEKADLDDYIAEKLRLAHEYEKNTVKSGKIAQRHRKHRTTAAIKREDESLSIFTIDDGQKSSEEKISTSKFSEMLEAAEQADKAYSRYGVQGKASDDLERDPFLTKDDVEQSKVEKEKRKAGLSPKMKILGIIMAVLVIIGAGFTAYQAYQQMKEQHAAEEQAAIEASLQPDWDSYEQVGENEIVHVIVNSGDGAQDVRDALLNAGLVSIAREFLDEVEQQNASGFIVTGEYVIPATESTQSLVKRMIKGIKVAPGIIGINPGDTIRDIAYDIANDNTIAFTADDFIAATCAVNDYKEKYSMLLNWTQQGENEPPTVEGYLASGEYDLSPSRCSSAIDAVDMMLTPMQAKFEQMQNSLDRDPNFAAQKFKRILTIASLIEEEALFDEDRPLISSVITNRLATAQKLQIDASAKYAAGSDEARVLDDVIEFVSPYNTYVVDGLPIGPICSGIDDKDIEAAMNPAQTDYFYYVLKDKEGHHEFCVTEEEHEQAKVRYLQLFGYTEDLPAQDIPAEG